MNYKDAISLHAALGGCKLQKLEPAARMKAVVLMSKLTAAVEQHGRFLQELFKASGIQTDEQGRPVSGTPREEIDGLNKGMITLAETACDISFEPFMTHDDYNGLFDMNPDLSTYQAAVLLKLVKE